MVIVVATQNAVSMAAPPNASNQYMRQHQYQQKIRAALFHRDSANDAAITMKTPAKLAVAAGMAVAASVSAPVAPPTQLLKQYHDRI